jgi:2-keto-4-pentenoate hydratase
MIANDLADDLSARLIDQRNSLVNVSFPQGIALDRAAIYQVQERVTKALGSGADPAAYKISWLPLELVESTDEQGCFAGIPSGWLYGNGAEIDTQGHRRMGFECEIACRIGVDAKGRAQPIGTMLGIEVIEEHSDIVNRETIKPLLAAGMFNAGFVLGPEVPGWPDLKTVVATVWRNGIQISQGPIGDSFDPDQRLQAFLQAAEKFGWPLRDGMIISTGALNRDVWCAPGDKFVGEIEGIGQVSAMLA